MHVVELYLTTEVSYRELELSLGINNPPMIAKWVPDYRAVGPDALLPKRKGRKPKVSTTKKWLKLLQAEMKTLLNGTPVSYTHLRLLFHTKYGTAPFMTPPKSKRYALQRLTS